MKASTQHINASILFALIAFLAIHLLEHSGDGPLSDLLGFACFIVSCIAAAASGGAFAKSQKLRQAETAAREAEKMTAEKAVSAVAETTATINAHVSFFDTKFTLHRVGFARPAGIAPLLLHELTGRVRFTLRAPDGQLLIEAPAHFMTQGAALITPKPIDIDEIAAHSLAVLEWHGGSWVNDPTFTPRPPETEKLLVLGISANGIPFEIPTIWREVP